MARTKRSTTGPTSPPNALAKRRAARRVASRARSDERYERIRDAATQVFYEKGYEASTLEDVAQAVGVHRASLYYYVGDKAELLIDILGDPVFQMTEELIAIRALPLPASERLALAVQKHMDTLQVTYPNLFIFFAENLHVLTAGTERDIVQNARRYGDVFADLIRDGQRSGEFSSALDPRLAMLGIVGMCNWSHRWYSADGQLSLSEIGAHFAELAVRGVVSPSDGAGDPKPARPRRPPRGR